MFFSKDLIHTMAYVGMFVAAIISVGACKSGIWVAAILAWIVAGIIIGLAIISDYKKAELLKNGTRIIGKVTATKRVHIKFHMSTYHLADEDVIYPYVVHYQYKVKGETYNGKSQWFWFNPCIPKGAPIKILVDPKNRAGLRQEVFGNFSKFIRLSARKPLVTSCLHISLNIFSIGFLAVSDCFTHTIKVVLPICTE